eukprot:3925663-Amphidinium_carterae.1
MAPTRKTKAIREKNPRVTMEKPKKLGRSGGVEYPHPCLTALAQQQRLRPGLALLVYQVSNQQASIQRREKKSCPNAQDSKSDVCRQLVRKSVTKQSMCRVCLDCLSASKHPTGRPQTVHGFVAAKKV